MFECFAVLRRRVSLTLVTATSAIILCLSGGSALAATEPFVWGTNGGVCNLGTFYCDTNDCMDSASLECLNSINIGCSGNPETSAQVYIGEIENPLPVDNGVIDRIINFHCVVNDGWYGTIKWTRPKCSDSDDVDEYGICLDQNQTNEQRYAKLHGTECPNTGHPCQIDTGDKILIEKDYQGPGLNLFRTYHSYAPKNSSPFGSRWMHSYADYLDIDGTNLLGVVSSKGYYELLNLYSTGVYHSISGTNLKVEQVGSEFVAHFAKGEKRFYDDTTGQLLRVEHVPGQITQMSYVAGELDTVTGPFGHTLKFTYNATSGKISRVELPSTYKINYGYTSSNGNYRLGSVNYPDKLDKSYHYEHTLPDLITGISDFYGNRLTTYAYDAQNRAIQSELTGGVDSSTLNYDAASGTATTVTDANGNVTTYAFSTSAFGFRKLDSVTVAGDQKSYTYEDSATDARRRLLTKTDELGRITTYGYDDFHRTSDKEATGTSDERVTTYQYLSNESPKITRITRPSVRAGEVLETVTTYNALGLPATIAVNGFDPQGNAVQQVNTLIYNANGQVTNIDGPRTDVTDVTTLDYYNCTTGYECGQLKTVTNAAGHITTYNTYDHYGRVKKITDLNGLTATVWYSGQSGPSGIKLTLPSGGSRYTSFAYHHTGPLRQVRVPDGFTLNYMYDDAHQLVSITDNLGNKIEYDYDSKGNRTDENVYDTSGVLKRAVDTAYTARHQIDTINNGGFTTDLLFDAVGNLTDVDDPNLDSTDYVYDPLNRLKQTIDALSGSTLFAYDVNDNITSVTAVNNAQTTFKYDDLGNLLEESSPDRGLLTYTVDAAGNRVTALDARGKLTSYDYDELNRLTLVTLDNTDTIDYVYDTALHGKGRLHKIIDSSGNTEWKYNSVGDVTEKTQTIGTVALKTKYYRYAYTGFITSWRPPSNTAVYNTYTGHQLTKIQIGGEIILSDATYDPFGPVNGWTWGNSTTHSRNFDLRGLVDDYSMVTDTRDLGYDAAGQLITLDDLRHNLDVDYDALGRLTDSTFSGSAPLPASQVLTYDANGNRASMSEGSLFTYSKQANSNRLLSTTGPVAKTYTYDAAGNVTGDGLHTYGYDDRGRLVDVDSGSVTYEYNGQGQRIKKDDGTDVTLYAYNEDGQLIGEYTGTGSPIAEHFYFDGLPVAVRQGITNYYVHPDHLGTPRAVTSGNTVIWRWESDAFGATAAQDDPDADSTTFTYNLRFPGQYYDSETGLHYNYFRTYDPATGRYLESDPIGLGGGLNTYGYVGGNPLSYTDRYGLCSSQYSGSSILCSIEDWMTDILTDIIADQMADDGVLLPEDQWDPDGAYDYCPTDDSAGAELGALATIFGGAIIDRANPLGGKRKRAKTSDNASDQFESIERAQRNARQQGKGERIQSIEKSRQREKFQLDRIDLDDLDDPDAF